MDPIALRTSVRDIVESAVERLGYDLVAVEWTGNPAGRAVLRLSIDQPPGVGGGVSAGDCAKVSRAVEPLLDAADRHTRVPWDDPKNAADRIPVEVQGLSIRGLLAVRPRPL